MKRKIIYALLILIGVLGIYSLLHLGFGLFHTPDCSSGFDSKADIAKGDIHLITYGLPYDKEPEKIYNLTMSYGFFFANGGCSPRQDEEECADIYNKEIIDYLSARNGKDWYKKFEKSYDSLEAIIHAPPIDDL